MFDATFFVAVSFFLFVGFVVWAGFPTLVLNALDERSEAIQKELDEARILHEEAQSLLAKEKRKFEKCDEEVQDILKRASDQVLILAEDSKKALEEEIQRKQKQADLKISQARDEAIIEVRSKATDLSVIIAREYLKENIDDKISSDLIDNSIEELKRNL